MSLKNIIKGSDKKGSYITEAAISLPALIISVCALILVIKIAAVCEGIWYAQTREVMDTGLRAYKNNIDVSLCERIEKKVLNSEKSLTNFKVSNCRYLYGKNNIDDLISAEGTAVFRVVNALGIDGRIKFDTKIMGRGFTGALRDGVPLGQEEFKKRDNAVKVWVFPRYGMRFHIEKCKYVKMYDKEGSYKLVMDEKDAGLKGFSPCLVCGGAANA